MKTQDREAIYDVKELGAVHQYQLQHRRSDRLLHRKHQHQLLRLGCRSSDRDRSERCVPGI